MIVLACKEDGEAEILAYGAHTDIHIVPSDGLLQSTWRRVRQEWRQASRIMRRKGWNIVHVDAK